ncbi:MAG: carboxypeptidase-like regulatory domain-containing protein [Planctomycetota bacterium]
MCWITGSAVGFIFLLQSFIINGRVSDEDGEPIKNAYVAGLHSVTGQDELLRMFSREGEFRNNVRTDEKGNFRYQSNRTGHSISFVIAAPGFDPLFTERLSSGPTAKREFILSRTDAEDPKRKLIRLSVIDEEGAPIVDALINHFRWLGYSSGSDSPETKPTATTRTDENGIALVAIPKSNDQIIFDFLAKDRAPFRWQWNESMGLSPTVRVPKGTSIIGQVLREGEPVKGMRLSINRHMDYLPRQSQRDQCTTDQDGRFEFKNLIPQVEWSLYSLGGFDCDEALRESLVKTLNDGETIDLGSLEVPKVEPLRIIMKTKDGKPVSSAGTMYLRTDNCSPSVIRIDEGTTSGTRFTLRGVADDHFLLGVRIPNYEVRKPKAKIGRFQSEVSLNTIKDRQIELLVDHRSNQ